MREWTVVCRLSDGKWMNRQNIEASCEKEAATIMIRDNMDLFAINDVDEFYIDNPRRFNSKTWNIGENKIYCIEQDR